MGSMTARSRATLADLDAIPEDGQRYELIDGEVVVTPAPSGPHNELVDEIWARLRAAAPDDHVVITGYQLHPPGEQRLIPDVSVITAGHYRLKEAVDAPLLVVEVLSPSTAGVDLSEKLAAYAAFGVVHYWVAEPGVPAVAVLRLDRDGRYQLGAQASGTDRLEVTDPFAVDLVPAELVRHRPVDAALEARIDLPAAVSTALSLQA